MCEFFKESSEKMLAQYGKEPEFFLDLIQKTTFEGIDFGDMETIKHLHKKKYRLGEILDRFKIDVARGIGFGVNYPDLVQKMWIKSYECVNQDEWKEVRRYGLDIPEKQTPLPLNEMEKLVLEEISIFVKENHPDLIKSLGLD